MILFGFDGDSVAVNFCFECGFGSSGERTLRLNLSAVIVENKLFGARTHHRFGDVEVNENRLKRFCHSL